MAALALTVATVALTACGSSDSESVINHCLGLAVQGHHENNGVWADACMQYHKRFHRYPDPAWR
jgi:hypothetical protein